VELGPVDVVVLVFSGDVDAATLQALNRVTSRRDIRLIDALVVRKGADGDVVAAEFTDVESFQDLAAELLARGLAGLIGIEDADEVGELLDPGSSALVLLVEHLWAAEMAEAVRAADGRLLSAVRIPHEFIDEAARELEASGDSIQAPADVSSSARGGASHALDAS
jgi:uncharacterized membrane protein